jgi:uracil-DNA glycosylase
MIEKIETLFEKAKQLQYDESCGMKVVEKMKGAGFFPGCTGFHNNPSEIKNTFVMVVGQDFATEEYHQKIGEKGEVDSNATWRNLIKLLKDIDIQENICFFTNAYMGLRKNGKNVGQSPAKKSLDFTKQCQNFFKGQLRAIKPELVLILGREPAKFVANTFPDQFNNWQEMGVLKQFYEEEKNIFCDLKFENKEIRFLFALHPSMSNTNRAKIWKGVKEKETDMLRNCLSDFYSRHNIQ